MVLIRSNYGTIRKTGYITSKKIEGKISIECLTIDGNNESIDNNVTTLNLGGIFKIISRYKYLAEYIKMQDGTLIPLQTNHYTSDKLDLFGLEPITNTQKIMAIQDINEATTAYTQNDQQTESIKKLLIFAAIGLGVAIAAIAYLVYMATYKPEDVPNILLMIEEASKKGTIDALSKTFNNTQNLFNPGV